MKTREQLISDLEYEMNHIQGQDTYYFEADNRTIIWNSEEESYIMVNPDGSYDYACADKLVLMLAELSDAALLEYADEEELETASSD